MLGVLSVFLKRPLPTTKIKINFQVRRCGGYERTMKVLNVAEKNDAAKTISSLLSKGTAVKRNGVSIWNKIYEFPYEILNQNCTMVMTSVSGHVLNYEFQDQYRFWNSIDPISLFDVPIVKKCIEGNQNVMKNLQNEVKNCKYLIIWTDCDREGENIGFEVIDICRSIQPNIQVFRAKFSEITYQSVVRAIKNLEQPNKYVNDAVNVRMELDLRIGAAFTRFQCLYLRRAFPDMLKENIISYGSCQFPTMGFVVERFKAISDFVAESFWKINVQHNVDDKTVNFLWSRNHLFDKLACEVLADRCMESKTAKVTAVNKKPKTKWRPKPLNTVELEKIVSRKLNINAKETLKIAEKLYTQGFISYPRTETNIFPKELNLVPLVQNQTSDPHWGDFAKKVLTDGPNPFQGKQSDQAHPPIHPIKYTNELQGKEKSIYEFIVRHFLACLSKHAEGFETQIEIHIAEEKFLAKGLEITARNYLDVYPYEKWNESEVPEYKEGETFTPEISMSEGQTNPPDLLTEADLIALMEKHGIGTDATHAEHIDKIKSRLYVGLQNDKYFVPRTLGVGLIDGYSNMGYQMSTPNMRAELEADLGRICTNEKTPSEVLTTHLKRYKEILEGVKRQANCLSQSIQMYTQVEAQPVDTLLDSPSSPHVKKCSACQSPMILRRTKKDENDMKYLVGCSKFPACKESLWFPSIVKEAVVTDETCPTCGPDFHMIRFSFERGSCYLPTDYVGCVGGCDDNLMNVLWSEQRPSRKTQTVTTTRQNAGAPPFRDLNDSGYSSVGGSMRDGKPRKGALKQTAEVVCKCKLPAKELTVKNSGPNHGRNFYKCGSIGNGCNFFEWADEISPVRGKSGKTQNRKYTRNRGIQNKTNTGNNSTISSIRLAEIFSSNKKEVVEDEEEETIRCYCAVPTKKLVVQKEGPNKGREFFTCGKPRTEGDKCNFFKWVAE